MTYGHCAAFFHASEKLLLSTKIFPDLGNVPGNALAGRFRTIPDAEALDSPDILVQLLQDQIFEDEDRSLLASYMRHMMFSFVILHEYAHCILGHCIHKQRTGARALLREFGTAATSADDVTMHHAFEFMADGHAATYVVRSICAGLDLPTRVNLAETSTFNKVRIAVLGIAVVISMWYSLEQVEVPLHPSPERRLLHILDNISWALRGRGFDEAYIERILVMAMSDLKEASSWSDDIAEALRA